MDVRIRRNIKRVMSRAASTLPLHELKKIGSVIPDQEAPVYVYCLSGARSRRSAALSGGDGVTDDGYGEGC